MKRSSISETPPLPWLWRAAEGAAAGVRYSPLQRHLFSAAYFNLNNKKKCMVLQQCNELLGHLQLTKFCRHGF